MRALVVMACVWAGAVLLAQAQSRSLFPGTLDQHPAIDYHAAGVSDAVSTLQREIEAGTATLAFDGDQGFLRAVLSALRVPIESQILLFSKTGIQHPFTTPEHPRALYFNDHVVVGYIPGAPMLETASHDPRQGLVFQTLKQEAGRPAFVRPDRCLTCHLSANSLGVPGILVRSMFTDATGRTRPQLGSAIVDHRTPLAQRWGGWYVTGLHGAARHMGNAMVTDRMERGEDAIADTTLNRRVLPARVDTSLYPSTGSDITALLVFDHQGHAMNLLTRLGWETRVAEADGIADVSRGELRDLVDDAARYLVFADEAPLPAPVEGIGGFAAAFAALGPRDTKGRSLREFDLRTRLFRYRCSYMIYSPAVDALPRQARAALYARMRDLLTARGDAEVLEILNDTRQGWR